MHFKTASILALAASVSAGGGMSKSVVVTETAVKTECGKPECKPTHSATPIPPAPVTTTTSMHSSAPPAHSSAPPAHSSSAHPAPPAHSSSSKSSGVIPHSTIPVSVPTPSGKASASASAGPSSSGGPQGGGGSGTEGNGVYPSSTSAELSNPGVKNLPQTGVAGAGVVGVMALMGLL